MSSGLDNVSFTGIASETLQLGSGDMGMHFISPGALTVSGGSGTDTIIATSGNNSFTAGSGTLNIKGGSGDSSYVFHAGDGLLTIEDFSTTRDSLTVDKSLQGSFHEARDGSGIMITFGTADQGVHITNMSSLAESKIHFT